MNVDIYLRKSRLEEQSNQAETLKRHKDTLYKIADSMELNVVDVFEEVVPGESIYARPQMLALLNKVEEGGVDAVLCMDIDRLGRGGMRDQGLILDVFKDSNTLIITPDHTYNLNDDNDEQLTEFKSFISRQEYKQIKKRFRVGRLKSIKEGCFLSMAPYGYKNITKDKKPTLEIVEDEAKIVRLIFDQYCQGLGSASIASMLNAMGVKPHRVERFRRESVMWILRNPVYTGKVVWDRKKHIRKGSKGNDKHITIYQPEDKWIIVDGLHPAIIEDEQFSRAQTIARDRYIPPSNDGTVKSPLAGIVRCARCGHKMQRMPQPNGTFYLLCNKPGCCAGVQFDFVEEQIITQLRDKLDELHTNVSITDDSDKYIEIHRNIMAEISKVQKQKDNLHTLLEQGVYTVELYRERMAAVSDLLDALHEQEQSAAAAVDKHRPPDRAALAEKITLALDVYYESDAKGRNQLLKSIIDHVLYYKEKKTKPQDFEIEIFYK